MEVTVKITAGRRTVLQGEAFLLPVTAGRRKFNLTYSKRKGWARNNEKARLDQCLRHMGAPMKLVYEYLREKALKVRK